MVNVTNGNRFETYAIPGRPESGEICVNGAAARLVHVGDMLIIMTFALMEAAEAAGHHPRLVHVDGKNYPSS
jgi:aspartate 1-decarboxylase